MRYAVTFTIDGDWNTVDTFIVETDVSPMEMADQKLIDMFESYICDSDDAEKIASDSDLWFIRHLDDTDVMMPREV